MVEKQSGHYIKILRTDRGREFASNNFLIFYKTNGIKGKFTTSYTPQKNGIAERKNRTIMDMARSMCYTQILSPACVKISNTFIFPQSQTLKL